MESVPKRYERKEDYANSVPVHVVWELTLACNLKCLHCGSRAGKKRPNELSTEQCFEIIDHLAALGTREISIIGGEAFLRADWLDIIRRITESGIDCSMQTGAYNLTEKRITDAKAAGLKNIGVSVDGTEDIHNYIRGKKNSFEHVLKALHLIEKHNLVSSVNTVITQNNFELLEDLLVIFISLKVKNWQVQLAVAMGNAVDNEELLIQPYQVKDIQDKLFELYLKGIKNDLLIQPGNNIGYYGPHESIWRQSSEGHWTGCSAGQTAIGIEADGTIKACPSLPTKGYTAGNVKELTITDIWKNSDEIAFSRYRNTDELWGGCKSCYYAEFCNAGCTWTGHVLFGKRGNNPYCYHRVEELDKKKLKERIVKVSGGDGSSFDHGSYIIEVFNEKGEVIEVQDGSKIDVVELKKDRPIRIPEKLKTCYCCNRHIKVEEEKCPFCSSNYKQSKNDYEEKMSLVYEKFDNLMTLIK